MNRDIDDDKWESREMKHVKETTRERGEWKWWKTNCVSFGANILFIIVCVLSFVNYQDSEELKKYMTNNFQSSE